MSYFLAATANPIVFTIDFSKTLPAKATFNRASVATYFNNTGTVSTSSNDVIRVEFDNNANSLGYLLENNSTNLSVYSKYFNFDPNYGGSNGARWGSQAGVVNSISQPDVFGGNQAAEIVLHSFAEWDFVSQYAGLTAGKVYTWSCYLKLGTATNFVIAPNDTTNWNTLGLGRAWSLGELSTTKWTRVYYTFVSSEYVNMHFGHHQ